jgi:hypothetical protein
MCLRSNGVPPASTSTPSPPARVTTLLDPRRETSTLPRMTNTDVRGRATSTIHDVPRTEATASGVRTGSYGGEPSDPRGGWRHVQTQVRSRPSTAECGEAARSTVSSENHNQTNHHHGNSKKSGKKTIVWIIWLSTIEVIAVRRSKRETNPLSSAKL